MALISKLKIINLLNFLNEVRLSIEIAQLSKSTVNNQLQQSSYDERNMFQIWQVNTLCGSEGLNVASCDAHLNSLSNIPTKYQLPVPYSFQDISLTRF